MSSSSDSPATQVHRGSSDNKWRNGTQVDAFLPSLRAKSKKDDALYSALVQPTPAKVRDALEKLPGFGGTGIVSEHLLESFEYIDRDAGFLPWTAKRSTVPAAVGPNPRKLFDAVFPGEPYDKCLADISTKVRSLMRRHVSVNGNRVFCDRSTKITIDTHVVQQNLCKQVFQFVFSGKAGEHARNPEPSDET